MFPPRSRRCINHGTKFESRDRDEDGCTVDSRKGVSEPSSLVGETWEYLAMIISSRIEMGQNRREYGGTRKRMDSLEVNYVLQDGGGERYKIMSWIVQFRCMRAVCDMHSQHAVFTILINPAAGDPSGARPIPSLHQKQASIPRTPTQGVKYPWPQVPGNNSISTEC